ncbi:kynureninase [Aliiglaciecola lipolytica]|uniref:Kynureninase n=1 Tax=Aliiglaciecola lipolytica E3 TaxID=1127673 RepID=K6YC39_9ALTE|nr:kynureninase [Aliiglaciecola lipolytica]GAC14213.1 kynureninase [Aliiglaciecola lipolytica E3]
MAYQDMISTPFAVIKKQAEILDENDTLQTYKRLFALPENCVYLDGNSLGALPICAKQRAIDVVEQQWGRDLITSWNKHQWIDLPTKVGEKIARLIGAAKGQTICCDSISVNLFKLVCAALAMQPGRNVVLSQTDNFPTDLYMVQGIEQLLGQQCCTLKTVPADELVSGLNEDVAVLLLTQVNYRTGYIHDMEKITKLAHEKGIIVIWDLAHSAGVLDLKLDQCAVDFAVGCTYKYLNGGPGAPGFMYVAKRHQPVLKQPLSGWMGHSNPFEFTAEFVAKNNVEQCLTGTPTIISMSILDAALDVFDEVSMLEVAKKSQKLTDFFMTGMSTLKLDSIFECISPQKSAHRGSQVALNHPYSYAICQALIAQNVIADFRAPDTLRLGFAPLYVSYADVATALLKLAEIVQTKAYLRAEFNQQSKVT